MCKISNISADQSADEAIAASYLSPQTPKNYEAGKFLRLKARALKTPNCLEKRLRAKLYL